MKHPQVQLRPPTRADELPFVDARYCKSLNSLIASVKDLTASKKIPPKNAELILDRRTRSGFIQSPNLRSLTSRIVHVYRTGLLAAIRWISVGRLCCLMSSDVSWHIRDKLWPMPKHGSIILYVHGNQKSSLGRTAQDGHIDSHTAPELWWIS